MPGENTSLSLPPTRVSTKKKQCVQHQQKINLSVLVQIPGRSSLFNYTSLPPVLPHSVTPHVSATLGPWPQVKLVVPSIGGRRSPSSVLSPFPSPGHPKVQPLRLVPPVDGRAWEGDTQFVVPDDDSLRPQISGETSKRLRGSVDSWTKFSARVQHGKIGRVSIRPGFGCETYPSPFTYCTVKKK